MTDRNIAETLKLWAEKYNDPVYFTEDPIIFPRHFAGKMKSGQACRQDVETAGLMAAHLAWGRRSLIVRDATRLFDAMNWKPYDYVMRGQWNDGEGCVHRTIKWKEIADICARLRNLYENSASIEGLSVASIRTEVFGSKPDGNASNKKINMFRRWMVRDDGRVDLGIWKDSDKRKLLIPLDIHVFESARELGLTARNGADGRTVEEITAAFREIFPDDPCLGDFALFGHGIVRHK